MLRFDYDSETGTFTPSTSDNNLQLEKITDINGDYYILTFRSQYKHFFNANGQMIKEMDTNGNAITYKRSSGNGWNLEKIIDPAGRVITVVETQDSGDSIITFTDWTGRQFIYRFATGMKSYTDPAGNTTEYGYRYPYRGGGYDNNFLLQTITYPEIGLFLANTDLGGSPNANKVEYQWFANGLIKKHEYDWDNGTRTVIEGSYDGDFFKALTEGIEIELENTRTFSYNLNENWFVTSETDTLGCVTTYTHDSQGRVLTTTDPRGGVKSVTYNSDGKVATATDKLGNTTGYEYDSVFLDSVTKVTSPAPFNYEGTFTYDSTTGNLLTKTTPSGKTTTYTYYTTGTKKGLLHTVTDPNSNTTTFDYDFYGNMTKITDALSKDTTMTYDELGRLKTVTDAEDNTIELFYDVIDNVIKVRDPLGNETQSVFDSLNRLISTINPQSRSTLLEYDDANNIVKTTDAAGNFTEFIFDIFDNKARIVDQMGRVYKFEYDEKNRITQKTDPLGRITGWSYDPYCGTTTKTDAKRQVSKTYTDLLCRVTRQEYENSNAFNIEYDELGRKISVTSEGSKYGNVLYGGATDYGAKTYGGFKYDDEETYYGFDPDETKTYTYDQDNNLLAIGFDGELEFLYEYDNTAKLTQVTDVNGIVTEYDYNNRNDMTVIRQGSDEFGYSYDDARRITSVTYPNGIVKGLTYDNASRVTQIKYSKDSDVLIQLDYEFDSSGNITKRTETRKGLAPVEYSYYYDELNQLILVDINGRNVTRYEYDPAGNRLKKEYAINRYAMQTLGGLKGRLQYDTIDYTYDAANQLLTAGDTVFKHDKNGNMTEKIEPWDGTDNNEPISTTYQYNRANRLYKITFPDGSEIKHLYDYEGLRTQKTDAIGKTTKYYWNTNTPSVPVVLSERNGSDNPITSYAYKIFSPLTIKTQEPGNSSFATAQNKYYLEDHLSSVLALTNEKATITDQYNYDEYGIPVINKGRSNNNYGYTGQDYDEMSGLLYLRARYYDQEIGLFLKNDPLFIDSDYIYSNNSPILLNDISGNAATLTIVAICGGIGIAFTFGLPITQWWGCHKGCLGLKVNNFTDPERAKQAIWDEFMKCPDKYVKEFKNMDKNQYTNCVNNCLNDAAIQNNKIVSYGIGYTTILALCGAWAHPTTGGLIKSIRF